MARRDEELLGRIAVREGFLSQSQIEECVGLQEEETAYRPLGALLIEKGYLEPRQLHAILQKQGQSAPARGERERLEQKRENDRIFSKICLSRGLVTFEDVNESLKLQTRKQKKGVFIPLSRLLIQRRKLSTEQVREVYKIQFGVVFFCPDCQVSYQIPDYREEKDYSCPKCGAVLDFQDIKSEHGDMDADESGGIDPITRVGGEARIGRYKILSELGRGAMGLVYLANDDQWKRQVALKILPGGIGLNADTVERFKREAEAVRGLDHPGIIPVYDVGVHEGTHFYTMMYVKGTSLDVLIEDGRVDPQDAVRMILQAAEALDVAHKNGIVHRDIKPENLIHETETGRIVVTDFGLAKAERSATLTASEAIVGTPCYMSPEQARGQRHLLDHRTDIYSLGATLYELLTYQLPFEGEDVQDILRQVVEENPEPPRRIDARIPKALEAIVLKAMAKKPGKRYASMKEFAGDLKRFLRGRKVRAKPLGILQKIGRLLYRHREVVVLFLLVQTLILTGGLFLLYRIRQKQYRQMVEDIRVESSVQIRRLEEELAETRSALAVARQAADARSDEQIDALLARVDRALDGGDRERARDLLRQAQAVDPASWRVWLRRGRLYLVEGNPDWAMADLERADRLSGGSVEVGGERARCLLALGQAAEALALGERLLVEDRGDPAALSVRVRALQSLERPTEARDARAEFEREADACRVLDAGRRLERFEIERIRIAAHREVVTREPGPWQSLARAVDAALSGDWEELGGVPARLDGSFPPGVATVVHLLLSRHHLASGRSEPALASLEAGLTLDEEHPVLLCWRGNLIDLRRAVELAPEYVEARVRLAAALIDRRLFGQAGLEIDLLERLDPGNRQVVRLRQRLR